MLPLKTLGAALLLVSSAIATNPWEFDDTDFYSNIIRGRVPANELELNTKAGPILGHYALAGADTSMFLRTLSDRLLTQF